MILRRSFTTGLALAALTRAARSAPLPPPVLLEWMGGWTIQNLTYQIVFLGPLFQGSLSNDRQSIEKALSQLTQDSELNGVFPQYFKGNWVMATARNSICYADPPWDRWRVRVFQNDLRHTAIKLAPKFPQSLSQLANFAVLFVLPPGTILSDHDSANSHYGAAPDPKDDDDDRFARYGNSLIGGMAAYHGHFKVPIGGNMHRLYYGVSVWSDGQNGVAVPGWEPWQNVCAALYHELGEIRLNPDVSNFTQNAPRAVGWVVPQPRSLTNPPWCIRQGSEIGDLALDWASVHRDATFPLNVFEIRKINNVDCPMHHLWDNQNSKPWT